jgi:hypothetical protein
MSAQPRRFMSYDEKQRSGNQNDHNDAQNKLNDDLENGMFSFPFYQIDLGS